MIQHVLSRGQALSYELKSKLLSCKHTNFSFPPKDKPPTQPFFTLPEMTNFCHCKEPQA